MSDTPAPLAGVKVLDLTRALAGPFCTMLLGDLGAQVVKVENPNGGDETRSWGPPYAGTESTYYLSANRNKRGITVNIRDPRGAAIIRDLGLQSDIVVENFGVGVAERYGLDAAALQALNHRLIYCTIDSFRPGTSLEGVPGYDFVIQAMSGLMSITGSANGQAHKVGVAVCDILTGIFAATAVLAALHDRERATASPHVRVSLLDATLASLVNVASAYLSTGVPPGRWGNAHASLVPYQTFTAADGEIAIGVGNDGQFARLCTVLGHAELTLDSRFLDNSGRVQHREALLLLLGEAILKRPVGEWVRALQQARVPAGPVNGVDDVLDSTYTTEARMIEMVEHPTAGLLRMVANPLLFNDVRPAIRLHPPLLGEHTDDVLQSELGLDTKAIEDLRTDGVI